MRLLERHCWGVRKKEDLVGRDAAKETKSTPIKPLSEKKQAKVDKFLKNADVMDTKISELKVANKPYVPSKNLLKRYDQYVTKQAQENSIKQLETQKKRALKDAEAVQSGKLTRKQKQVIAGAVVVTTLIGVSVIASQQQSGALNSWKLMGQQRLRGQKSPFKINKELAAKMSAEDLLNKVAKPVNPNYSLPGGKMNCRRSTYAYELRRRGYDVHATASSMGYGQSESGVINALTTSGKDYFRSTSMSETVITRGTSAVAEGDKRVPIGGRIYLDKLVKKTMFDDGVQSSSKRVLEELAKQPNGARGEVLFKFKQFGHSMAYEVVNGVPKIFDSQKGTMYDASKLVESKWDGFSAAEIRRLDNLDLDINFLTRWATNVKR